MRRSLRLAVLALGSAWLVGCAGAAPATRQPTAEGPDPVAPPHATSPSVASATPTAPGDEAPADEAPADGDHGWQRWRDLDQLLAQIQHWQAESPPNHAVIAEAYASLAARAPAAQQANYFAAAAKHAEAGMRQVSREFSVRRDAGFSVATASENFAGKHAGLQYWWAFAIAQWAARQGMMAAMQQMPDAKAVMQRLDRHAATIDDGGPSRWLGGYYAKAPAIAGGDLAKSRQAFERATQLAPSSVATLIAFAELYAVEAKQPDLRQALLQRAAATPTSDQSSAMLVHLVGVAKAALAGTPGP